MINESEEITKYADIIDKPYIKSTRYPQMSMTDRGAQFSPFAALTGHGEAIKETARFTDSKIDLSDSEKERLNEKFLILLENINENPIVEITYFIPDSRKNGGKYIVVKGYIKKFDEYTKQIYFSDGNIIELNMINEITGEIFDKYII